MSWFKNDGWRNLLTGLGVSGIDKRMEFAASWSKMSEIGQEDIYASDEIATKIVDYLPEEMVRKGYKFTHPDAPTDFDEKVKTIIKEYDAEAKLVKTMKDGRLTGSAFMVFGMDDGQEHSEPLNKDKIKSVDWINTVTRWDLSYDKISRDITTEFFRSPEIYSINDVMDESILAIHASRMLRCDGAYLPRRSYELNGYFHDSVLNKVQNSLRNYNLAHDAAASTLEEFSMGIFKMKDLAKLIGSGQEAKVIARLNLINAKKSVVRAIVMDTDEEYKRETVNLSGVPNIIQKVGEKLTADSNMPHTIILGEGATGTMGGGGLSETRNWYDYVARKQVTDFKPKMLWLVKILMTVEGMEVPEGMDMEFESLYEYTDPEKADMRLKTSQADASDITNQVLDPDEVAINRYGSGKYDMTTQIDTSIREESLSDGGEDEDPLNEDHMDVIEQEGNMWVLYSKNKEKVLGKFVSKEKAIEREIEIQALQKVK